MFFDGRLRIRMGVVDGHDGVFAGHGRSPCCPLGVSRFGPRHVEGVPGPTTQDPAAFAQRLRC